jgi:hypothetical protein
MPINSTCSHHTSGVSNHTSEDRQSSLEAKADHGTAYATPIAEPAKPRMKPNFPILPTLSQHGAYTPIKATKKRAGTT